MAHVWPIFLYVNFDLLRSAENIDRRYVSVPCNNAEKENQDA